jgi:hypothetical protein
LEVTKEKGGIKIFSSGDALKTKNYLPFTLLFETKMDFHGEGPKLFLC